MSSTEPVVGQNVTKELKPGTLENIPVPGLPNGPCQKCGKATHDTEHHGKNGGPRAGGGRPKGALSLTTIERMKIKAAFEDRIHSNADRLLNAALTKALGEAFLFHKYTVGTGAKQRTETEVVTDVETIIAYLNDELEDGPNNDYYYISTKPVDMFAVKELYDRAFGRSPQKVEETGEKKIIIETRHHKS